MKKDKLIKLLTKIGACPKAIDWAKGVEEWWNICDRGDWLIWYLVRLGYDPTELYGLLAVMTEWAFPGDMEGAIIKLIEVHNIKRDAQEYDSYTEEDERRYNRGLWKIADEIYTALHNNARGGKQKDWLEILSREADTIRTMIPYSEIEKLRKQYEVY